jgi:DNA mismatch endonuclease (patch repair protein)
MDRLSTGTRSALMARVKTKNTAPELRLRSLLHSLGYRYRLHRKDLPGSPDLVFAARKKVIFVHGCFWHSHHCPRGKAPTSNREFWNTKLAKNKQRDSANVIALRKLGWKVKIVWECQMNSDEKLIRKLIQFLEQ